MGCGEHKSVYCTSCYRDVPARTALQEESLAAARAEGYAACRADVTELLDLLDAEAQGWLDSGNRLIGDGIGWATRAIRARLAANKEKT